MLKLNTIHIKQIHKNNICIYMTNNKLYIPNVICSLIILTLGGFLQIITYILHGFG